MAHWDLWLSESYLHPQVALERFESEGFLIFPGFLSPDHTDRLLADMAQLPPYDGETRGAGPMVSLSFPTAGLGGLPTHPPTIELVSSVMGGRGFAMRHLNAQLFRGETAGNTWHTDYPCGPPGDPYPVDHGLLNLDRRMCHALYYPEGLNQG